MVLLGIGNVLITNFLKHEDSVSLVFILKREEDIKFKMKCAWCNTDFEYSYLKGGITCINCGNPTGQAKLLFGRVRKELWQPDFVECGRPEGEMIPHASIIGWNFRCDVTTGALLAFLKECAMLEDYNPVTLMSTDTARIRQSYKRPTWHWSAHVSIPLGKRPFLMQGVEWHNESTVRGQSTLNPKIKNFLAEYDSLMENYGKGLNGQP